MKKRINTWFLIAGMMSLSTFINAQQWAESGSNLYPVNFSSLNVGIGTDAPAEKLHVNGSVRGNAAGGALRISTQYGYVDIGPMNGSWAHIQTNMPKFYFHKSVYVDGAVSSYGTLDLDLQTNGVQRMKILSSNGNVGIGTNEPQTLLNLSIGAGNAIVGTPALRLGGTNNYPSLEFGIKGAYDGMISTFGNDLHIYAGNWRTAGATASENHNISFYTSRVNSNDWNTPKMFLRYDGNLGIGTSNPDQKLTVKGIIHTEEVRVDMTVPGPDYVFEPDYDLKPLSEVESYIKANKHLPEVPSAKEMEEEGLNLKEMNLILLKKVEELTLHLIEMNRTVAAQGEAIKQQAQEIKAFKESNK